MKEGSMLEAAERALIAEGKELKFADLWGKVKADLEITPEEEEHRIGRFYTDLSMSGRFVVLGENVWDLRTRHTYDKVHIDVNDVYSDVDERDNDSVEEAEENEYNESVRGYVPVDDENASDDDEEGDSKPRESAAELLGIPGDNY
ncbi:MAG: DNA-directed RNA polymerase subunit delta [Bacilli bacterium]|nr:DNA-directed RNA polymerase subunit delta [Bacilli bacterium]